MSLNLNKYALFFFFGRESFVRDYTLVAVVLLVLGFGDLSGDFSDSRGGLYIHPFLAIHCTMASFPTDNASVSAGTCTPPTTNQPSESTCTWHLR